jgi:hypothetical protein
VKTAIVAMLLATAIISPASAKFKVEKPCGSRGAERCIVLPPVQSYVSTRPVEQAPNHVSTSVWRDGQGNVTGTSIYRSWWNY